MTSETVQSAGAIGTMAGAYAPAASALVTLAILYVIQLLVVDVTAIRLGHVPGTPVVGSHDDALFRATRAHANTNENFALFVAALLGAMLLGADAAWINPLAWTFVGARAVHALAYWTNRQLVRSGAFVVGLAATAGLIISALFA